MGKVRVYMACSLDGFIAGPNDELDWLNDPETTGATEDSEALQFDAFMAQIGAMLMGRRTHDVVLGMDAWPYGETPVLVATTRELTPAAPTVRAVSGTIDDLVDRALAIAGGKDVYLDGGDVIRQALNAGRVDELCITLVPILLGEGIRLFDHLDTGTKLVFTAHHSMGNMVQLTARVA